MLRLYRKITEVKQFGKSGIVCKCRNMDCVADLVKCATFAGQPVGPFIHKHLACVKEVVQGFGSSGDAAEVLERLSDLGVVDVYRCSIEKDICSVPTETCLVSFAGARCPSELKVWPLIFRVSQFYRKPQQCRTCFTYGHGQPACKSAPHCRICSGARFTK